MKMSLAFPATLLFAATLAACSPGINGIGHRITFDSTGMVVHASGQPNAHVTRAGDLSIDGKPVAVTPAERALLQQYYQQSSTVLNAGIDMGKQGVDMAAKGIGTAIASIFHGDSSAAEKKMDTQSANIEAEADKLCAGIKAIGITQDALAAQLPAFKPYAAGNQMQCHVSHTVTVNNNGTSTTATFTTDSPATSTAK